MAGEVKKILLEDPPGRLWTVGGWPDFRLHRISEEELLKLEECRNGTSFLAMATCSLSGTFSWGAALFASRLSAVQTMVLAVLAMSFFLAFLILSGFAWQRRVHDRRTRQEAIDAIRGRMGQR